MSTQYSSVSQTDTTFGNPRQKTWAVFQYSLGWALKLTTTSFSEAQSYVKDLLAAGGMYTSVNKIIVCEIVPIDIVIAPTV